MGTKVKIEYFTFKIEPWMYNYGDSRSDKWKIIVQVNGVEYTYDQIIPETPFNKSQLEMFFNCALDEFRKINEEGVKVDN